MKPRIQLSDGKWDERFIVLAEHISSWSKDRSRKVGCVIVGPDREIRSTGYNGFPRDVDDDIAYRHKRPDKYQWTEHAERNAIYNAARMGLSLKDCTAYVPWFPCIECARAIIQSGITRLVTRVPDFDDPKYGEEFRVSEQMLGEADMTSVYVAGKAPKQKVL